MSDPVTKWLETFMCQQYAPLFNAHGYDTLQSVCQLHLTKLMAMGIPPEHCNSIIENVSILKQTLSAEKYPQVDMSSRGMMNSCTQVTGGGPNGLYTNGMPGFMYDGSMDQSQMSMPFAQYGGVIGSGNLVTMDGGFGHIFGSGQQGLASTGYGNAFQMPTSSHMAMMSHYQSTGNSHYLNGGGTSYAQLPQQVAPNIRPMLPQNPQEIADSIYHMATSAYRTPAPPHPQPRTMQQQQQHQQHQHTHLGGGTGLVPAGSGSYSPGPPYGRPTGMLSPAMAMAARPQAGSSSSHPSPTAGATGPMSPLSIRSPSAHGSHGQLSPGSVQSTHSPGLTPPPHLISQAHIHRSSPGAPHLMLHSHHSSPTTAVPGGGMYNQSMFRQQQQQQHLAVMGGRTHQPMSSLQVSGQRGTEVTTGSPGMFGNPLQSLERLAQISDKYPVDPKSIVSGNGNGIGMQEVMPMYQHPHMYPHMYPPQPYAGGYPMAATDYLKQEMPERRPSHSKKTSSKAKSSRSATKPGDKKSATGTQPKSTATSIPKPPSLQSHGGEGRPDAASQAAASSSTLHGLLSSAGKRAELSMLTKSFDTISGSPANAAASSTITGRFALEGISNEDSSAGLLHNGHGEVGGQRVLRNSPPSVGLYDSSPCTGLSRSGSDCNAHNALENIHDQRNNAGAASPQEECSRSLHGDATEAAAEGNVGERDRVIDDASLQKFDGEESTQLPSHQDGAGNSCKASAMESSVEVAASEPEGEPEPQNLSLTQTAVALAPKVSPSALEADTCNGSSAAAQQVVADGKLQLVQRAPAGIDYSDSKNVPLRKRKQGLAVDGRACATGPWSGEQALAAKKQKGQTKKSGAGGVALPVRSGGQQQPGIVAAAAAVALTNECEATPDCQKPILPSAEAISQASGRLSHQVSSKASPEDEMLAAPALSDVITQSPPLAADVSAASAVSAELPTAPATALPQPLVESCVVQSLSEPLRAAVRSSSPVASPVAENGLASCENSQEKHTPSVTHCATTETASSALAKNSDVAMQPEVVVKRKRGRPLGSKNKKKDGLSYKPLKKDKAKQSSSSKKAAATAAADAAAAAAAAVAATLPGRHVGGGRGRLNSPASCAATSAPESILRSVLFSTPKERVGLRVDVRPQDVGPNAEISPQDAQAAGAGSIKAGSDKQEVRVTSFTKVGRVREMSPRHASGDPPVALTRSLVAAADDSPWLCVFCHEVSNYKTLGDLFGPYRYVGSSCSPGSSAAANLGAPVPQPCPVRTVEHLDPRKGRSASKTSPVVRGCSSSSANEIQPLEGSVSPRAVWYHEDCLVWAPGVSLVGQRLVGLDEAIALAEQTFCSKCKRNGAMLGCYCKGCSSKYHYVCALEDGCMLTEENFSTVCPRHNRLSASSGGFTRSRDSHMDLDASPEGSDPVETPKKRARC